MLRAIPPLPIYGGSLLVPGARCPSGLTRKVPMLLTLAMDEVLAMDAAGRKRVAPSPSESDSGRRQQPSKRPHFEKEIGGAKGAYYLGACPPNWRAPSSRFYRCVMLAEPPRPRKATPHCWTPTHSCGACSTCE